MAASRGDHVHCPPGTMVNNRYKVVKECGCGNFSKVFECIDTKDEQQTRVAVKFLKKEYASDASFERDILKGINAKDSAGVQKVTKVLDYFVHNRFPTFVFPLKGPSLRSCKLGVTRQNLPQDEMRAFAKEMLHVLKFLHKDVKMVHTDIKPENILLDRSLPTSVQGTSIGSGWTMCDFGSASFLRPDRLDSDLISTRPYRAPEVVMGQGWSTSADIWSIACVFFEVQAGSRLFEVHDDNDHLHAFTMRLQAKLPTTFTKSSKHSSKFFNHDGSFRRPTSKSIRSMNEVLKDTPDLLDLLKHMMCFDPKQRLTADEALAHPFFTGATTKPCSKASSAERIAEEGAAVIARSNSARDPIVVKKGPSPTGTAAATDRKNSAPVSTGAAFPNVLQERAAKLENIEPKVRKTEVKSAAAAAAGGTTGVNSGRYMAPSATLEAAKAFKVGERSSRMVPAAGRPSYSARAQAQQSTLGSGRYY